MPRFIVDAGPFIHLQQIGHLKLLKHLARIIIPEAVFTELTRKPAQASLNLIRNWPNLSVTVLPGNIPLAHRTLIERAGLGAGETGCLFLACAVSPAIFLTDDRRARLTARKLGIEVHGSVGIIAMAVHKKWLGLNEGVAALRALDNTSSLFITPTIIDDAILRLKQLS